MELTHITDEANVSMFSEFHKAYNEERVPLLSKLEAMNFNERAANMLETLFHFDETNYEKLFDLMKKTSVKKGPFSVDFAFSEDVFRCIKIHVQNKNARMYFAPAEWYITYEYHYKSINEYFENIHVENNKIYADTENTSAYSRFKAKHTDAITGFSTVFTPDLLKSMIDNFDSFEKDFYAECEKLLKFCFIPSTNKIVTATRIPCL